MLRLTILLVMSLASCTCSKQEQAAPAIGELEELEELEELDSPDPTDDDSPGNRPEPPAAAPDLQAEMDSPDEVGGFEDPAAPEEDAAEDHERYVEAAYDDEPRGDTLDDSADVIDDEEFDEDPTQE